MQIAVFLNQPKIDCRQPSSNFWIRESSLGIIVTDNLHTHHARFVRKFIKAWPADRQCLGWSCLALDRFSILSFAVRRTNHRN